VLTLVRSRILWQGDNGLELPRGSHRNVFDFHQLDPHGSPQPTAKEVDRLLPPARRPGCFGDDQDHQSVGRGVAHDLTGLERSLDELGDRIFLVESLELRAGRDKGSAGLGAKLGRPAVGNELLECIQAAVKARISRFVESVDRGANQPAGRPRLAAGRSPGHWGAQQRRGPLSAGPRTW